MQLQVLLNSVTAVERDLGIILQKSQPARRESESARRGGEFKHFLLYESCSEHKHWKYEEIVALTFLTFFRQFWIALRLASSS